MSAETRKLHHARGLYLGGIRDGNIEEAIEAHMGARYTQHSTGVANGPEGFAAFFGPFMERNPERDIRILRAFEDGPYVFVHVYQNLNNGSAEWVTGDIFETDENDRLIEHWDVIEAYCGETKSGRTMADGPTGIEDPEKTEANKEVVRKYHDEGLLAGDFDRAAEFISPETFHQHEPGIGDGLEGFREHVREFTAPEVSGRYWKVHKLIGQGNFVATLVHSQRSRSHFASVELYRLKDARIVEHWSVSEQILPPEEWNNQGKF